MDKKTLKAFVSWSGGKDLKALDNIDLCGEKGEYHTFVFEGPIFEKRIKFNLGKKIFRDNYCFLEIKAV